MLEVLALAPLDSLDDDLKLLKLRVLEVSFARQGRPSAEAVKALVEELSRQYPAKGGGPEAAKLNRELSQLLIWLTNPELGELNADLIEKAKAAPAGPNAPTPAGGKTGDFRPPDGPAGQSDGLRVQNGHFSAQTVSFPGPAGDSATARDHSTTARDHSATARDHSATARDRSATARDDSATARDDSATPPDDSAAPGNRSATPGHRISETTGQAFAQAQPISAKAPADPEKEGTTPAMAASPVNTLGPVPNPGASVFPGRKGAPDNGALAAAGREVIEKTLALMDAAPGGTRSVVSRIEPGADRAAPSKDAAPSQEEQIQYALALRWAHGWSPEQRVRYFRWFHEKAARYTGGNSFAKFVEAIRADAASRVPESERAALSQWLRPVAAPTPAAALKPRAFVKAWTLPELETALDALKDRQPDLARGLDLYTQAQCAQCHLFRDAGGNVGPDLTAVAQRFGRHDILESITDPSKVVSDQYAMVTLTILDGQGGTSEVSGLIKEETSATITLLTDPLTGKTSHFYTNVVTKREKAAVSIMPPGLLYTLTAEEVADLLALFGAK